MAVSSVVLALATVTLSALAEPASSGETARPRVEDIVATVNGTPITRRDVDIAYQLDQARRAGSRLTVPPNAEPVIKQRLVYDLINAELLYQEAIARGLKPTADEVARQVEACKTSEPGAQPPPVPQSVARHMTDDELAALIERSLALRHLVRELAKDHTVTDEEARSYYDSNKAQFWAKEEVLARHILVKTGPPRDEAKAKERIEKIRDELRAGADFAELARKYSDGPTAEQGGDMGWVSRGFMAKEFEKVVFSTPVGSVSEPVKTRFGYHLVKVEGHNRARQLSFEEVREQIVNRLIRRRTDIAMQKLATRLRQQGNVWQRQK